MHGHRAAVILRPLDGADYEFYLLTTTGPKRLGLPTKGSINALIDGQLIFSLRQEWKPLGSPKSYGVGSILSFDLRAAQRDPIHLKLSVVFTPRPDEFLQSEDTVRAHLVLTTLDHVRSRAWALTRSQTGGLAEERTLPFPTTSPSGLSQPTIPPTTSSSPSPGSLRLHHGCWPTPPPANSKLSRRYRRN